MRGDSLQDFYAKALALFGLGVLAAAGALVDYWPTSQRLPDVARALTLPGTMRVVTARAFAKPLPATMAIAVVSTRPMQPSAAMASSSPAAASSPSTRSDVVEAHASLSNVPAPDAQSVVATAASSAPAAASMPALDLTDRAAADRAPNLMTPVSADDAAANAMGTTTAAGTSGDGDDSSFLTGAVKRTGSSIMRGGTKTGTSIVGAFRALGGAVRRAFPG